VLGFYFGCAGGVCARRRELVQGAEAGVTESALVQDGMLERNTVLLQKPFTVKKILEVIQQMNSSVRS